MTLTPSNYAKNSYSKSQIDNLLNEKQDTLVSGTNIKTVNDVDLLGSGNVVIGEGGTIAIDQTYNSISTNAQSGTAVADALKNSMESVSANGTISNCILEIPQNIKMTLENNVLTLKAGSVLVKPASVYTTVTVANDVSSTISAGTDGLYVQFAIATSSAPLQGLISLNKVFSGTEFPTENLTDFTIFFNIDEYKFYYYRTNTSSWTEWNLAYPPCLIEIKSGVASFAKDSNGRDMIFNGAGFIGTTLFVYPNIKHLYARGFNDNGTLKSVSHTMNALVLRTFDTDVDSLYAIGEPASIGAGPFIYDKDTNYLYFISVSESNKVLSRTIAGHIKIVSGIVTDFTIRQPYDGARYLLTDEIKEEVATKQADLTTVSGYDATKIQTLKNVNGVLTWVDDE